MNKIKKLLSLTLAFALLLSLAACGGGNAETEATEAAAEGAETSYTVSVETMGGMVMPGVDV